MWSTRLDLRDPTRKIAAARARTRLPDCIPQTSLGDGPIFVVMLAEYVGFHADAIKAVAVRTRLPYACAGASCTACSVKMQTHAGCHLIKLGKRPLGTVRSHSKSLARARLLVVCYYPVEYGKRAGGLPGLRIAISDLVSPKNLSSKISASGKRAASCLRSRSLASWT
jgi:hypothetical protein